jgi:hypothetical protein
MVSEVAVEFLCSALMMYLYVCMCVYMGDATGLSDLSVVREITYEPTTQQLLMYVNALPGPTRSATLLSNTAECSTA